MKKLLNVILAIVMAVATVIGMAGCNLEDYLPEYETEYFRYAVRTKKDGTKEGYLIGFTELGAQQEYLILPNEIDGVPIISFGYQILIGPMETADVGNFASERLNKLFVPFRVSDNAWRVSLGLVSIDNCYSVQWKNYFNTHYSLKGKIVAYRAAEEYFNNGENSRGYYSEKDKLANVIYKLNYRGAPDNGYYWVDSYDNSTVDYIPPEPTRKGFRFEGWYKEPNCENAWDFETDKTGDEIIIKSFSILDDYDGCEITRLYAKWVKN